MKAIRRIIEQAPENWWTVAGLKNNYFSVYEEDAHFIATFSPDHVALMESVIESVDISIDAVNKAIDALKAYRKERGLND